MTLSVTNNKYKYMDNTVSYSYMEQLRQYTPGGLEDAILPPGSLHRHLNSTNPWEQKVASPTL